MRSNEDSPNHLTISGPMADYRTRRRLIEAAGQVFAEQGYDNATGRDICALAQVNPSAINYHFGGKDALYLEVLREADNRYFSAGKLKTLLDDDIPPEDKLRKLIAETSAPLLSHSANTWHTKLMTREMIEPTKATFERAENEIRPKFRYFREIVGQVMGLPSDHPATLRGAILVMSQISFLFRSRGLIELMMPELKFTSKWIKDYTREAYLFSLAGLRALADEAQAEHDPATAG